MAEEVSCPVHSGIQATISHLQEDIVEIKGDSRDQWSAINKLRWVVAMGAGGAGVLAFLGSIIGAWLKK